MDIQEDLIKKDDLYDYYKKINNFLSDTIGARYNNKEFDQVKKELDEERGNHNNFISEIIKIVSDIKQYKSDLDNEQLFSLLFLEIVGVEDTAEIKSRWEKLRDASKTTWVFAHQN